MNRLIKKSSANVQQCANKGRTLLCFRHLSESRSFAWRFTQKKRICNLLSLFNAKPFVVTTHAQKLSL